MATYDLGDPVDVTLTVDIGDVPTDATVVSLTVVDPAGVITTPAVSHDGTGTYSVQLFPALPGTWQYRWVTTGAGQGAETGTFVVKMLWPAIPLATFEDFARRYEGTIAAADQPRVIALLEDAAADVRDYVGQAFSKVFDDVINLSGNGQRYVRLPQRPVVDVTQVAINGRVIQDWRFDGYDSIWRPGGWGPYRRMADNGYDDGGDILNDGAYGGYSEAYADTPAIIQVTYSHGYNIIPASVVKIVCALARRAYVNPDGLRQEKIGDYSYRTDGPVDGAAMYLTDSEKKTLDRYRRHHNSAMFR